ncbi:hypothetical protein HYU13_05800, partial [Candidatus Woesearchaeota archaeon]|nr:hypothetical protein [Candidatus Woesearchaeota archaeon]
RDNWTFSVVPSDGIENGEERFAAQVTIANSPPGASEVSVSPAKPFTTNTLNAVYTYSDEDLDPQGKSEIKWYKNSAEQSSLRNKTAISSSFTAKNQYWHFTVRPFDGTSLGQMLTSAKVKIQNSAPTASSVVVSPSIPKAGNPLTAKYTFKDADNDKEKTSLIKWYKNGKYQSSLKNKKTVSGSLVKKGDKWYFSVQPYDGASYGTLKKASQVTVK